MAASIDITPDLNILRIQWLGYKNEPATNVVTLGSGVADADIETYMDDVAAVSEAGIPRATLSGERFITGLTPTPGFDSPLSQVNNMLVLSFSQPHPLNAALTITKSVQLRAPNAAVIGDDGALIVASVVGDRSSKDENLRGVVNFLQDNLVYEAIDGSLTTGGWTFNEAKSAYVSAPSVIDGA